MEQLLLKACKNGQKGVVLAFLKKDVNINAVDEEGYSSLHYA
ncbi:MAG: ankyrin repeat domain-containing protein [Clostridiales bacterium]|nr:ankyrin repeat domain-containing protein [Clostridiales bacterium]